MLSLCRETTLASCFHSHCLSGFKQVGPQPPCGWLVTDSWKADTHQFIPKPTFLISLGSLFCFLFFLFLMVLFCVEDGMMFPQFSWSSFSDFPTTTPPAYTFHQKLSPVFKDFSQLSWLSLNMEQISTKIAKLCMDSTSPTALPVTAKSEITRIHFHVGFFPNPLEQPRGTSTGKTAHDHWDSQTSNFLPFIQVLPFIQEMELGL